MATREQEWQDVRRLLGHPKEQKPSNDLIIAGLIRTEQFMMNRLNGSGRGWSPNTLDLTVEADTAEYLLYTDDPTNNNLVENWGKSLFVYRELDDNVIVPVPRTDYNVELDHQGLDIIAWPGEGGEYPSFSGEKVAFYRDSTGRPMARFYPVPAEERVYKIVYATGAVDWSAFEWSDVPPLPEWSNYRCIMTAIANVRHCEWDNLTPEQNERKRNEYRRDLADEFALQEPEFNAYIRNPQHEPSIAMVGGWWER